MLFANWRNHNHAFLWLHSIVCDLHEIKYHMENITCNRLLLGIKWIYIYIYPFKHVKCGKGQKNQNLKEFLEPNHSPSSIFYG